eukprot:TRINITY_DN25180_c0_g1_i1.p1 TRINITY_DN25180_c0_g1~~TRINITY_DN25180_c0_g1_i1.p1  ORF type:complete len:544 (+),score=133.05 TRINITY_DN25180_c0_g1_i1:132-1763(+)
MAPDPGYAKPPRLFGQLPHVLFVRVVDKVSSRGARQKRAVIVSPTVVVVSHPTALQVKRFIDVRHISGVYKQLHMKNSVGKASCALLLSMQPSSREHDLLLLESTQTNAGHASVGCMGELLKALATAKWYHGQRLPLKVLPRGDEVKSKRDDILDYCFMRKDKDAKKCKTPLVALLESRPPPPLPQPAEDSEKGNDSARALKRVSFAVGLDKSSGREDEEEGNRSAGAGPPMLSASASASMLTIGRAQWEDDKLRPSCSFCNARFTMTRRRHHCRSCGKLACEACTAHRETVPGYERPQRVCNKCYKDIALSTVAATPSPDFNTPQLELAESISDLDASDDASPPDDPPADALSASSDAGQAPAAEPPPPPPAPRDEPEGGAVLEPAVEAPAAQRGGKKKRSLYAGHSADAPHRRRKGSKGSKLKASSSRQRGSKGTPASYLLSRPSSSHAPTPRSVHLATPALFAPHHHLAPPYAFPPRRVSQPPLLSPDAAPPADARPPGPAPLSDAFWAAFVDEYDATAKAMAKYDARRTAFDVGALDLL